ncbi:GT-D fold domain-containing glycosyltransferase [Paenibacillus sp. PL91]|uniref:GT-D fold domain-containing protein n=1 Tax=Paenibacillus sp. PL91 TaxID=2729538 RepID=UPI00145EB6E9|nr:GT-D fold domain-containing glycosyltransferase [Paenibacillus sp. PL91]MBC9200987.1 hypothetical protein [Paenibacillus sp. PL91]
MQQQALKRKSKRVLQQLRRRLKGKRKLSKKGIVNGQHASFNTGYNSGYNDGYNKGYDLAFDKGVFEGGDAIVDQQLPAHVILPSVPLSAIIAAGLAHFEEQMLPLLPASDVYSLARDALLVGKPLSIVRLGDGELLTMAQGMQSLEQIQKDGSFLHYAGIDVPDFSARDMLLQAILQSSVVGIPKSRYRTFSPLAISIFDHYGIPYRNMALTQSTINYSLYLEGFLLDLLGGVKVLLVGNEAPNLREKLAAKGIHVVDAIAPVQGIHDVPRVMNEILTRDFDIALVSAGVPAVILVQRIAAEMGKVAIDFGHLANKISNGEAPL